MDLNTVKKFLRVDYDDEDEIIKLEIEAAKEYIKNAVGIYVSSNPLMNLLLLTLVTDMFEKRSYTVGTNEKCTRTVAGMVLQLQLQYGDDEDAEQPE